MNSYASVIKCEGIYGLIGANIAARKRDIEIIYWITLCIPIAIRFWWITNDNLKRIFMTMMMSKSPQESVNMETFVRPPPSYFRNGRKCIGSKGLHFNLSHFIQCLMKPTSMQNNFQHDFRNANHSFSAVTRSVTKIERSLDVQNPEIFCG